MLLANKQVARFTEKGQTIAMVYEFTMNRSDKLNNLQSVVAGFGYKLNLKTKNVSQSINLLLETQGKQEQNMIDTLTIRCMIRRIYHKYWSLRIGF